MDPLDQPIIQCLLMSVLPILFKSVCDCLLSDSMNGVKTIDCPSYIFLPLNNISILQTCDIIFRH